jgi:metal-responsive CopG/Arc/MetJ family transcriptional regulator
MSGDRTTIHATKSVLDKIDLYVASTKEFRSRSEFFRVAAEEYINRKGNLWLKDGEEITIQVNERIANTINALAKYDNVTPEDELKYLLREAVLSSKVRELLKTFEAIESDKKRIESERANKKIEDLNKI